MRYGWLLPCLLASFVNANVEKTIFTAPAELSMTSSNDGPSLSNLCLLSLTPQHKNETRHRLSLPVSFPSETRLRGHSSWYLLQKLRAGQRYEVRVCWSATQPTDFYLTTYEVTEVFDQPELLSDLAAYSKSRQSFCSQQLPVTKQSVLLLKIDAAADFRSSDPERMRNPPNVLADIILDPFLLNIIPQSLVWTGAYIIVLIPLAFMFSGIVWRYLSGIAPNKSKTS